MLLVVAHVCGVGFRAYVSDLFHVVDHLIVAFGLLAEPGKEGFTIIAVSTGCRRLVRGVTFRAVREANVSDSSLSHGVMLRSTAHAETPQPQVSQLTSEEDIVD